MAKFYRLKRSLTIFTNDEDKWKIGNSNGWGDFISDFTWARCKSIEDLKNNIKSFLQEYLEEEFNENLYLIDNIIEKGKVESYEIDFPNIPCIIVKCEVLGDQFECDADKTPMLYLNSMKELENFKIDYEYEVYSIDKFGNLVLEREYSTYINY